MFQHDRDRHQNHAQTIYGRDGVQIHKELYYTGGAAQPLDPSLRDNMVHIAETIGQSFDFMRVDLFIKGEKVFLGELGLVPNGCSIPIRSPEIGHWLGTQWTPPWLGPVGDDPFADYTSTKGRQLFDDGVGGAASLVDFKAPWVK